MIALTSSPELNGSAIETQEINLELFNIYLNRALGVALVRAALEKKHRHSAL